MQISETRQIANRILKDRSIWLYALVFLVLLSLDQLSKYTASPVFKNYFFAFGIQLPVWIMFGIYLAVMAVIIRYLGKNFFKLGKTEKFAWVLIISGAILNLAERLVLGYVRDFIYITFSRWVGIYNLADGYIILGIVLLIVPHFFKNNHPFKTHI